MPLGTWIAGPYAAAYNLVAVGVTKAGFELEVTPKAEMIDETDVYGRSTLDWIVMGADCFMQYEASEYKAPNIAAFCPNGLSLGQLQTAALPVGRLASAVAKGLVLTSTANTPAAAAPASLTTTLSLLAPNYPAKMLFSPKLRTLPIRLQNLPYSDGSGGLIFFSTT